MGTSDVIQLYDVAAGKHQKTLAHEPEKGQAPLPVGHKVRFSPDGKTLAAACFDSTVRHWDVSGKEPTELPAITKVLMFISHWFAQSYGWAYVLFSPIAFILIIKLIRISEGGPTERLLAIKPAADDDILIRPERHFPG